MTRSSLVLFLLAVASAYSQPAAPKKPVVDTLQGVQVTDDYRWMEDYSDPAVRNWSDGENRYARKYLDGLPARLALSEELKRLYSHRSPTYFSLTFRAATGIFAIKVQPPKEQPLLVLLKSVDEPSSERVVLDPNILDNSGGTAIDFYVPSIDGKYVAVSLSKGGSESGDVHVFEAATGRETGSSIPHVNGGTAGGSLAWNSAGDGFYYTRYPRSGERPPADLTFYQQVYFHRLRADTKQDAYSLGKDFPRIAEIQLTASPDGRFTLARMANGDGGEFAHYLLGPDGQWHQIARLSDEITSSAFGADGFLYLLSHRNAPKGKILKLSLEHPSLASAQTVVPESKVVIDQFLPIGNMLYVADLVGGPSDLRIFDASAKSQGAVPILPVSSIAQLVRGDGDRLLFQNGSFLDPPAWYRLDPTTRQVSRTALYETTAADFSNVEVLREFAISKDGARIPLNILRRKGTKLDGSNPVLLTAYGGYGISMTPFFSAARQPVLERGFVIVIASLRGGGEYGEAWHRAGMLAKKQNVFDDFAASAKYLIDHKYTTPAKLAIEGGSNGGLLMGAALTQHPELFGAVVSHVGIYDMLRVELQPNGAFNVTEFGTVKEQNDFKALYAYSPYHHVVDGTNYPPVLFLTGDNDARVDPLNSRKMTARLQASGTKHLVLLRTSGNSGHGIGTALSETIAEQSDVLAFLFDQLGVD